MKAQNSEASFVGVDESALFGRSASRKGRESFGELALYAGVFLLTLILFLIIKPFYATERNGMVAQAFTAVVIGSCGFAGLVLAADKKMTARKLVVLLFIVGVALRIGYMLYTPATARQQDTFSKNFDGHEAYAWTIFSTGKLPATNAYQFYHPPLNAFLQAGFMRFMEGFSRSLASVFSLGEYFPDRFLSGKPDYIEAERYFLFQSCQILSVMYSVVACVVSLKILRLMRAEGFVYAGIGAVLIFFPRTIQFSGMLNNDGLAYMLSVSALYFALKWWKKDRSFLNILACAFFVGAGMMAKLSSATICLPIAGIFLYEFAASVGKRRESLPIRKIIGEYAAFLAVCAPLGLWFQIYARVRFDQPFGFVFSNLNHRLYTGDRSFFGRFFIALDWDEYFGSLWCRPFDANYNLFHYALRSAIFGEFSYWQGEGFALMAVVFAYVAVLLLAVALGRALYLFFRHDFKKTDEETRREKKDIFFVFLLVQSQALSEIYFYLKMPYGCTMDFRYIMPLILGIALTLKMSGDRLKRAGDGFSLALNRLTAAAFTAALFFSSLFYMVCI